MNSKAPAGVNPELWRAYLVAADSLRPLEIQINAIRDKELWDDDCLARFQRLTNLYAQQASLMMGLATRMRITNQQRFTAKHAATLKKQGGLPKWI
jgi:hypothetical protein